VRETFVLHVPQNQRRRQEEDEDGRELQREDEPRVGKEMIEDHMSVILQPDVE
jgi:hypothetical protein